MDYIYDKLVNYSESDYYGFHMPGHKRNKNIINCRLPYEIDITEIEGFDDLHHAKDLLLDAQKRAADVYHADETCFLINGSTSGLLSAIMGSTSKGDRILVARNCHKSVYHAIYMNELRPVYLYPGFLDEVELNGQILVEDIENAIEKYDDIKAVVITSPTYDGVVSDVKRIAEVLHEKKIPLIVDEAHGAHFGFHPYFPQSANVLGADIVINSLHKTLPALTQCAVIHMNGPYADRKNVRKYLHILQTSSPSYILMASMDNCIRLLQDHGRECFDQYVSLLDQTRERLKGLKHMRMVETSEFDKSKILISVNHTDMTGKELYEVLLEKYHLQMEMSAGTYILAMTSIGDTKEGMDRLVNALYEIDSQLTDRENHFDFRLPKLEQVYTSAQIDEILKRNPQFVTESLSYSQCEGKISTEYAYVYPPGIPLIVPGERISKEAVELLHSYADMNFSIEGLENDDRIEVLING